MSDFLTAANSSSRTAIPNFSTPPNWLFVNADRSYYPDDPLGETFSYEAGVDLVDPTGTALGDYYGRLLAHYLEPGGFVDEAGNTVPGIAGGPVTFSHWEVLCVLPRSSAPRANRPAAERPQPAPCRAPQKRGQLRAPHDAPVLHALL